MRGEETSSREIAGAPHISKRIADMPGKKIMQKAGVKNVSQLLRYAIQKMANP